VTGMADAEIRFKADAAVKKRFDEVCAGMGMNCSAGLNILMRSALRRFELLSPFSDVMQPDESEVNADGAEIVITVDRLVKENFRLICSARNIDYEEGLNILMKNAVAEHALLFGDTNDNIFIEHISDNDLAGAYNEFVESLKEGKDELTPEDYEEFFSGKHRYRGEPLGLNL
jgi:antitoxin component of RelBE/YafQ-DinJ toxin-antitoxin module